jgi:hypothetical protein
MTRFAIARPKRGWPVHVWAVALLVSPACGKTTSETSTDGKSDDGESSGSASSGREATGEAPCEDLGGGYAECAGVVTRQEPGSCEQTPEPPSCELPDAEEYVGDCISDAHCSAGATCRQTQSADICVCEQSCVADEDCGAGEICLCGAAYGGRNKCIPADCASNAECGDLSCQVSKDGCNTFQYPRAACRSRSDACQTDADCGATGFCISTSPGAPWECVSAAVCG